MINLLHYRNMATIPVTIIAEECAAELEFYRVSENVASAISYSVNAFLIYLIAFHTPNDLKVYSRVLLCASVVDILYTTVFLIIGAVRLLVCLSIQKRYLVTHFCYRNWEFELNGQMLYKSTKLRNLKCLIN